MWIINSHYPYIHKLHAEVRTAYTFTGIDEAKQAARGYNDVLDDTRKNHAEPLLKVIQEINNEVATLEARTPKDVLDEVGIE